MLLCRYFAVLILISFLLIVRFAGNAIFELKGPQIRQPEERA